MKIIVLYSMNFYSCMLCSIKSHVWISQWSYLQKTASLMEWPCATVHQHKHCLFKNFRNNCSNDTTTHIIMMQPCMIFFSSQETENYECFTTGENIKKLPSELKALVVECGFQKYLEDWKQHWYKWFMTLENVSV